MTDNITQDAIDGDTAVVPKIIKTVKTIKTIKLPKEPKVKAASKGVATNANGTLMVNTVTGKVTIQNSDGSETNTNIPLKEVVVTKVMINVGMSANHTKNLGNYSSAKIGVSLHVPCEAIELEDTYSFIKEWVNTKMNEVIQEIDSVSK